MEIRLKAIRLNSIVSPLYYSEGILVNGPSGDISAFLHFFFKSVDSLYPCVKLPPTREHIVAEKLHKVGIRLDAEVIINGTPQTRRSLREIFRLMLWKRRPGCFEVRLQPAFNPFVENVLASLSTQAVGLAKFQQSLDAPFTVTASKFFDLEQLTGRILESLLEPTERIILDSLSGVRSTSEVCSFARTRHLCSLTQTSCFGHRSI